LADGFDEFKKSMNNMINSIDDIVDKRFGALLDEVVADTQLNTPVDTGNLKASWDRSDIYKEGNVYEAEVGTDFDNAESVEFGHSTESGGFVKGQLMFTNAIKKAENKLQQVGEEILNDIIEESKL